jgi:hypothetical protein
MKILPVVAELFHADGQTDRQPIVDFSDFANALKNLVPASQQECLHVYVIRTDQLMTVRGIMTVYSYKS